MAIACLPRLLAVHLSILRVNTFFWNVFFLLRKEYEAFYKLGPINSICSLQLTYPVKLAFEYKCNEWNFSLIMILSMVKWIQTPYTQKYEALHSSSKVGFADTSVKSKAAKNVMTLYLSKANEGKQADHDS